MAQVWSARHVRQQVQVAIKVITAQLVKNERHVEAFRREVQAVARLSHPNVVRVYDEGIITDENKRLELIEGAPYFVMEYVPDGTLESTGGVHSWDQASQILRDLLAALAHAHACQIIHRDIKPANVLILRQGVIPRAKLTDFGISHVFDPRDAARQDQQSEHVTGTPRYMAPEQISGNWRDHGSWTDLYSLGCLAYWLVSGQPPFDAASTFLLLRHHLETEPPKLTPKFEVPAGFQAWVHTLMSKNPRARFAHAADALWHLEQLKLAPIALTTRPELAVPAELIAHEATELIDIEDVPRAPRRVGEVSVSHDPAPMPETWELPERGRKHTLIGAGLGLVALKPVPLIGRTDVLDRIWSALGRVRAERAPRAVILDGAAGVGKSWLAETIARRADEVGAAHVIRLDHSERHGPFDGFGGPIARDFRCADLSLDDAVPRILDGLVSRRQVRPELLHFDAVTLAKTAPSVSAESSDYSQHGLRFMGQVERYGVLARWMADHARARPVLCLIDDVQWGRDALEFVGSVLDAGSLPVLFVLTAREDALAQGVEERRLLDALSQREQSVRTRIEHLDAHQHRDFVSSLLDMDDALVDAIAAKTVGNPLFASQIVRVLIEQGQLVPSEEGFTYHGTLPSLPADMFEVWVQRADRVISKFSQRELCWACVEIAACLGQHCRISEFFAALDLANIPRPYALLAQLGAARLIVLDEINDTLHFTHGMMRESAEQHARANRRWASHNLICARVMEHAGSHDESTLARLGAHLLEANQPARALKPLLDAANAAMEREETVESGRLIALRRQALDALGVSAEDKLSLENLLIMGWIDAWRLKLVDAERTAAYICDTARRKGYHALLGKALRLRANIARPTDPTASTQMLVEAIELLGRYNEHLELAKALLSRGWNLARVGQVEEGLVSIDAAIELFDQLHNAGWVASATRAKGYVLAQGGRHAEASACLQFALREATRLNFQSMIGACHNALGEIERQLENWSRAREHYQLAVDIEEQVSGHLNATIYNFNIAMTELGMELWEAAKDRIDAMLDDWDKMVQMQLSPGVRAAQLVLMAARQNWRGFDWALGQLADELAATKLSDHDILWCLNRASALALAHGERQRARAANALAEGTGAP